MEATINYCILSFSSPLQLIAAATEQFNLKPKQGISFLQEQGVLLTPLDPAQVASFLRENLASARQGLETMLGIGKDSTEGLQKFLQGLHKGAGRGGEGEGKGRGREEGRD